MWPASNLQAYPVSLRGAGDAELEVIVIVSSYGSFLGGARLASASMATLYGSLDCLELLRKLMGCCCLSRVVYAPSLGCLRGGGNCACFAIDGLGV